MKFSFRDFWSRLVVKFGELTTSLHPDRAFRFNDYCLNADNTKKAGSSLTLPSI